MLFGLAAEMAGMSFILGKTSMQLNGMRRPVSFQKGRIFIESPSSDIPGISRSGVQGLYPSQRPFLFLCVGISVLFPAR